MLFFFCVCVTGQKKAERSRYEAMHSDLGEKKEQRSELFSLVAREVSGQRERRLFVAVYMRGLPVFRWLFFPLFRVLVR